MSCSLYSTKTRHEADAEIQILFVHMCVKLIMVTTAININEDDDNGGGGGIVVDDNDDDECDGDDGGHGGFGDR